MADSVIPRPKDKRWKKWASWAYGSAGLAYGLILALILIFLAGYTFLEGGETGITVMGWMSIALVSLTGPPILALLLAAVLLSAIALRQRMDGWLLLFAISILLSLLVPAAFMVPSSVFGGESGIWELPGPVVGAYMAITTLVPLLLVVRWFAHARRAVV